MKDARLICVRLVHGTNLNKNGAFRNRNDQYIILTGDSVSLKSSPEVIAFSMINLNMSSRRFSAIVFYLPLHKF